MKTTLCSTTILLTFVTLVFLPSTFAQDDSPKYVVRTIYVVPNDREPDPDIDTKLDALMKRSQKFFTDLMDFHGFGRKTFRLETDATGNVIVHHVNGKFSTAYYKQPSASSWIVWKEIEKQFDMSKNIYVLALDIGVHYLIAGGAAVAGLASGSSHNGKVLVPVGNWNAVMHELGHAFGLAHDVRVQANWWTAESRDPMITSFCAAEWLDVNRYFNPVQEVSEAEDNKPHVQMLKPSLVSASPHTIRLQFEITDPDGLHQTMLFRVSSTSAGVIACAKLEGKETTVEKLEGKETTVEFVTTELTVLDTRVYLLLIDVHGNFNVVTHEYVFPIDISNLLPPDEVISIPDPNLASAVRQDLGLSRSEDITKHGMLALLRLNIPDRQITDLTGLEYAINIRSLNLSNNQIQNITPLRQLTKLTGLDISTNPINDITSLAEVKNLTALNCRGTNIGNITPLARLTRLNTLNLYENPISDIAPLSGLTNLTELSLGSSQQTISDITHLQGLVNLNHLELKRALGTDMRFISRFKQLKFLSFFDVPVSDISPLTELTELRSLWLNRCKISDVPPLTGLKNLEMLSLSNNQINDITSLAKLTNLRELHLYHNQISDVSPLVGLVNLQTLNLIGNPIKDTTPLFDLLQKNPSMKIYLNDWSSVLQLPTSNLPKPTPDPPKPTQPDQPTHKVVFSEFMFESAGGDDGLPQWLEVHNGSTSEINLRDWKLQWKRLKPSLLEVTTTFKEDFIIPPQQSRVLVTALGRHSEGDKLSDDAVYQLHVLHAAELAQDDIVNRNRLITRGGFSLKLINAKDELIDHIGTLNGNKQTWQLHDCLIEGVRSSLIRRFDEGVPRAGTEKRGWRRAFNAKLLAAGIYYGHWTDLGTPGYRRGKPLPVELSKFSARFIENEVIIKWTTESELNNAGFNIYRSTSRTKNFRPINAKLIQGAGTTGKRTEYKFVDKTAKPNVAYYYRLEDVDFSGKRDISTTYRVRGVIAPTGKHITVWGKLKYNN